MWPKPDITAMKEYQDEIERQVGVRGIPGDEPAMEVGEAPHATLRSERQRDATALEQP